MSFHFSQISGWIGPKIVTDGLILYLDATNIRSYPTTGENWIDLTGNNNNGTLRNGTTFSSSNGGSILFDGIDDNMSTTLTNVGTNGTTQIIWYKWDGVNQIKILSYLGNPGTGGFGFVISNGSSLTGNKVCVYYGGSSFNALGGGLGATLTNNVWTMLTITRNATTTFLYQNTTLIGQTNSTPAQNTSTLSFNFGDVISNNGPSGNVSKILFYNRFFTSEEITKNFNTIKNNFGL